MKHTHFRQLESTRSATWLRLWVVLAIFAVACSNGGPTVFDGDAAVSKDDDPSSVDRDRDPPRSAR